MHYTGTIWLCSPELCSKSGYSQILMDKAQDSIVINSKLSPNGSTKSIITAIERPEKASHVAPETQKNKYFKKEWTELPNRKSWTPELDTFWKPATGFAPSCSFPCGIGIKNSNLQALIGCFKEKSQDLKKTVSISQTSKLLVIKLRFGFQLLQVLVCLKNSVVFKPDQSV